jgi:hypothetical protein
MPQLHAIIANSIWLYLLLVGLWGLVGYFRRMPLTPSFKGAVIISEVVLLVQALIGLILVLLGFAPRDAMHYLYGVGAPLGLPLAYTYARGREDRQAMLYYGLAALFVMGLSLRAMTTATRG